jgi:hypothetical protein
MRDVYPRRRNWGLGEIRWFMGMALNNSKLDHKKLTPQFSFKLLNCVKGKDTVFGVVYPDTSQTC